MRKLFNKKSFLLILCMLLMTACTDNGKDVDSQVQLEDVQLADDLVIQALPVLDIKPVPQFQVYSPIYSMRPDRSNMLVQAYNLEDVDGKMLNVNAQTEFYMELLDESRGLNYYNIIVLPGETLEDNEIINCARRGEIFWDENKLEILEETPEYTLLFGEKTYGGKRVWYLAEIDGNLVAIERGGWGFSFDKTDATDREEVIHMCGAIVNEHIRIYDNLTEEQFEALLPSEIAIQGGDFRVPAEKILGWYIYEIQWLARDGDGNLLKFTLGNILAEDEDNSTKNYGKVKNSYKKGEENPDAALTELLGIPVIPDDKGGYLVKTGEKHICPLTVESFEE